MKWFILLVSVVLAEGQNVTNYDCQFSQKVDLDYIDDQWMAGACSTPALSIRNVVADTQFIAAGFAKIRAGDKPIIESVDYDQIVAIGKNLTTTIQDLCARFQTALDDTPVKFTRSRTMNKMMTAVSVQMEKFLSLKPGNQKIELELSDMPAQPRYKSNNKNLTATDAFLHFAKVKDTELAAETGYLNAILWNAWKSVRKNLRLLQYQYRNEILNNQVMPAYRRCAEDIYASDVQDCVDDGTWSRFMGAYESIIKYSNSYIKSVQTGEKCY